MTIRYESNIWIDRPTSDVFAFMTEPTNYPKVMPGCIDASREDKNGGPDVGSVVKVTMSVLGSKMQVAAEWTRYEENKTVASKNVEGMPGTMLMTFHQENGGTRVERVTELEPKGFFGNLTGPLIRRTAARNEANEFATLKDLLEQR